MKRQTLKRKFGIKKIAFGLLFVLVLIYLGLPVGMGVAAVFPMRESVGAPPDGFEEISLLNENGDQLQAWYRTPGNGAAIILLHGAGGSRNSTRDYVEMLAEHGFGVLALDLSGNGESQGKPDNLGWQAGPDVGAAVQFLQSSGDVEAIGGLGISMGGEVLLGAASDYPQITAIAADGATRRSTQEYMALEQNRSFARSYLPRVMYAVVQFLSGNPPPKPLLESMIAARQTRFLFIAAGDDSLEVEFNQLFLGRLAERASLWIAPGVGHTGAFGRYPQEYEERLIAFFNEALSEIR